MNRLRSWWRRSTCDHRGRGGRGRWYLIGGNGWIDFHCTRCGAVKYTVGRQPS